MNDEDKDKDDKKTATTIRQVTTAISTTDHWHLISVEEILFVESASLGSHHHSSYYSTSTIRSILLRTNNTDHHAIEERCVEKDTCHPIFYSDLVEADGKMYL